MISCHQSLLSRYHWIVFLMPSSNFVSGNHPSSLCIFVKSIAYLRSCPMRSVIYVIWLSERLANQLDDIIIRRLVMTDDTVSSPTLASQLIIKPFHIIKLIIILHIWFIRHKQKAIADAPFIFKTSDIK